MYSVFDLNREQLIKLKEQYATTLANEGIYGEVVFDDETIEEPSYSDLCEIDDLIPDDIIFEHYEFSVFTDEDFF